MKRALSILMLSVLACMPSIAEETRSSPDQAASSLPIEQVAEVEIAPNGVAVPLGRIILVRRDSEYCAVKFTKFWLEGEKNEYSNYESYYQGDKSGDFSNKNAEFRKGTVSWLAPIFGCWFPIHFAPSLSERNFRCGPIKLGWTGSSQVSYVYFFSFESKRQDDYGFEIAPTKWKDISEVNVWDHRLKWYRYDRYRRDKRFPIDELWEDREEKK
jgi:hypothetical protein